jgi:hypothetical protein
LQPKSLLNPFLPASNFLMRTLAILFLTISAFGQSATETGKQALPVDQENASKARAIVDRGIQALGAQAYLNVKDLTEEGKNFNFHMGRPVGAGTIYWRFYKLPDKERVEFTKQRDVVDLFTADKAYEITFRGVREPAAADRMSGMLGPTWPDYFRRRRYSLDWVLRRWLNEPGIALFYEGRSVADGKSVDQVSLMNTKNESVTLFFDLETHLPIKKSYSWRDPTDKQRNTEEEIYANYREADGVMTPFTLTRFYNGDMSGQRFITSLKYNQGIDNALFDPKPLSKK